MTEDPSTDNVGEPDQDKAAEPGALAEEKAAAAATETTAVGAEPPAVDAEATAARAETTDAGTEVTAMGADGERREEPVAAERRDAVDDDELDVEDAEDLDADLDDTSEGLELAGLKAAPESADDSLDAILLQAGARPLEPASDKTSGKTMGSRTLMGFGTDGLNLASLRADLRSKTSPGRDARSTDATNTSGDDVEISAADLDAFGTPTDAATGTTSDANTPSLIESRLTAGLSDEDKKSTSLLDEVAQALNVQAAEYRDKARGRLPGMPGSGDIAATSRGPSSDAEFEDPDEGHAAALTPSVISVVEDEDAIALDSPDPADRADSENLANLSGPAVQKAPAVPGSGPGGAPRVTDSRPTMKVPPIPGLSVVPAAAPVGPPPGGAVRPTTPVTGVPLTTSGRVRLPTPGPGATLTLPPPSGRVTLPPGTMSPFANSGPAVQSPDLTATMPATPISIEASRRHSGGVTVLKQGGSGRVIARGSARVTEPVVHSAPFVLPAVLTAHVKMATLNLAGLIALTFAGGLFVGMMVWRGQTIQGAARYEPAVAARPATGVPATTGTVQNGAPATHPAASAAVVPVVSAPPSVAAEPVVAPLPPMASAPDQPASEGGALKGVPSAARTVRPKRPAAVTVAPAAFLAPSPAATPSASTPPVAKATSPKPAAPQTVSSKPMATNAAPKPVAKAKAKAVWRDPFAD